VKVAAILRLRCPRCLRGRVFAGVLRMNEACPECALRFEREPGYFLGAMYFSYGFSLLAGLPVALVLWLRGVPPLPTLLAVTGTLVVLSPPLYRYSRVLWLHFDQSVDPR
jgi:uncharacterized protein (DUF983 family)